MDTLILAGGRSTRMGRDKSTLAMGPATLIERTISAVRTIARPSQTIVVSATPELPVPGVTYLRENPPFAGPVAAICAALGTLQSDWVLLLPCDLADPEAAISRLLTCWAERNTTLIAQDSSGRVQWLTGIIDVAELHTSASTLESTDVPVRRLLGDIPHELCEAPDENPNIWDDMDTPEDYERVMSKERRWMNPKHRR